MCCDVPVFPSFPFHIIYLFLTYGIPERFSGLTSFSLVRVCRLDTAGPRYVELFIIKAISSVCGISWCYWVFTKKQNTFIKCLNKCSG